MTGAPAGQGRWPRLVRCGAIGKGGFAEGCWGWEASARRPTTARGKSLERWGTKPPGENPIPQSGGGAAWHCYSLGARRLVCTRRRSLFGARQLCYRLLIAVDEPRVDGEHKLIVFLRDAVFMCVLVADAVQAH